MYPLFKVLYLNRWYRAKKKKNGDDIRNDFHVEANTNLVWEGFPSCANSSSAKSIQAANGKDFVIVSHTHSSSVIIRGVKKEVPTVVLIRNPLDVVVSMMRRWPIHSEDFCFDWYIKFYKSLLPYRDFIVVSDFLDTTSGLDQIVEKVNKLFNTNIVAPKSSKDQWIIGKVMDKMTDEERQQKAAEKERRKKELREKYADKLNSAMKIYNALVSVKQ